jgi:hypothetical protein
MIPFYNECKDGSWDDKQWNRPQGLQWLIIGRDQSKLMPRTRSIGTEGKFFGGETRAMVGSAERVIGYERGYDDNYNRINVPIKARLYRCPNCGARLVNPKNGTPIDPTKGNTQLCCEERYAVEVHSGETQQGRDYARPHRSSFGAPGDMVLSANYDKAMPGRLIKLGGKTFVIHECGEQLWNYTRKPYRWAPADFIHRKMKGAFDYCIIDEVHESKSATTAQANAAARLIAGSEYVLALTGTLIGGYAWHLFPILMRIKAKGVVEDGFKWGQMIEWSRRYGRIDTVFKIKHDDEPVRYGRHPRRMSMRKCRNGKQDQGTPRTAPGVMPSLFSAHLMDCSVFLQLSDLAEHLPDLTEYIGCPIGQEDTYRIADDIYWTNCCVRMTPEQQAESKRIEDACKKKNDELLTTRSLKFLSAMLVVSMEWPDQPFSKHWQPEFEGERSVGYWELPKIRTQENWRGVVTPAGLPEDAIYPKEQKLIEICKREKEHGSQVWVYVQQTGKRDIQPRLKKILEDAGLTCGILRAKNVKPRDRIAWIEENGHKYDVMISHPKPVCTGLDLLSKSAGGHNFNAMVFYQTGTHAFVVKQASRRSWRVIQKKECRVYYLYYEGTGQHRFVGHMAKKFAAMSTVDGDFSAEGLAGMTGADDGSLDLARSLGEKIDDNMLHRNWAKVQGSAVPKTRPLVDGGTQVGEVPLPLPECGVDWEKVKEVADATPEEVVATIYDEDDWSEWDFTEEELELFNF